MATRMIVVAWRCNDSTSWYHGHARAAVWLNVATSHDLKRARAYVAKCTFGLQRKIFVLPSNHPAPLEFARANVPPLKR